jgi:hypothetical protein
MGTLKTAFEKLTPTDPVYEMVKRANNCRRKERFATKEDAQRIHRHRKDTGWKLYFYLCPICNGWHATKELNGESLYGQ